MLKKAIDESRDDHNSRDDGTQPDTKLNDIVTIKMNDDLQRGHVVLEIKSWHTMRTAIVVDYSSVFFDGVLECVDGAEGGLDVRWNNFYIVLHHG